MVGNDKICWLELVDLLENGWNFGWKSIPRCGILQPKCWQPSIYEWIDSFQSYIYDLFPWNPVGSVGWKKNHLNQKEPPGYSQGIPTRKMTNTQSQRLFSNLFLKSASLNLLTLLETDIFPGKEKFWSWCSELPVWWDMHPFPRGESFVCCINSFFWGQPSRGMDWLLECSRHLARRAQAHAQPRPCSRWCCCGEWWGNDPSNHVRSEWNTELCWVYSVGAEFANIILLEDNERSSYLLL